MSRRGDEELLVTRATAAQVCGDDRPRTRNGMWLAYLSGHWDIGKSLIGSRRTVPCCPTHKVTGGGRGPEIPMNFELVSARAIVLCLVRDQTRTAGTEQRETNPTICIIDVIRAIH